MLREEMVEQCQAAQNDEILALESIFPSGVTALPESDAHPRPLLKLEIPIVLAQPTPTMLHALAEAASSSSVLPTLSMEHLPPLKVKISLPRAYPLAEVPRIVDIRAPIPGADRRSSWLSRKVLYKIGSKIEELWLEDRDVTGEGNGIIWAWWEWIGSGQFLEDLDLLQNGQLSLFVPPALAPSSFHTLLKTFNAKQQHTEFEVTAFSCAICMENRKGKSCAEMPSCGCVFCTPCLSSCWSLAIEEGTLENVACPSVDCVKRRAKKESESNDIDSELVESVVGHELQERWIQLKERRRAEIDPNWTTCPRITCQAAVPPPEPPSSAPQASSSARVIRLSDIGKPPSFPDTPAPPTPTSVPAEPAEDRWARHRQCPKCQYSFCLYCSATWHGPHTLCAFPKTSALVIEYLSYPEGSFDRLAMEKRRGKANLERMVAQWKEDQENKKWLESRTRACAGCGVRVEKSHGCNHMTCGRCQAHFCYRCGASISPQDPYSHYNRPGQACFEKLFDQEEIDFYERQATQGIGELAIADDIWPAARDRWHW